MVAKVFKVFVAHCYAVARVFKVFLGCNAVNMVF